MMAAEKITNEFTGDDIFRAKGIVIVLMIIHHLRIEPECMDPNIEVRKTDLRYITMEGNSLK